MSRDIFDALDKAGFGSNVHEIAAEGECRVLRLDDESGEGFMTMYDHSDRRTFGRRQNHAHFAALTLLGC